MLGGRPDYRFDSRTIKRDSQASSLITSHVESSNLCIILSCLSWVVLYVRTKGFSIASKRAQDHRIRSPYAQVINVLVGCCWLSWGPRVHGVLTPVRTGCPEFWVLHAHGLVPCTRGLNPRAHRVPRKCPLEPQRLVSEFGYLRALSSHRLGVGSHTF